MNDLIQEAREFVIAGLELEEMGSWDEDDAIQYFDVPELVKDLAKIVADFAAHHNKSLVDETAQLTTRVKELEADVKHYKEVFCTATDGMLKAIAGLARLEADNARLRKEVEIMCEVVEHYAEEDRWIAAPRGGNRLYRYDHTPDPATNGYDFAQATKERLSAINGGKE